MKTTILIQDVARHRACKNYSPNGADSLVEMLDISHEDVVERTCKTYVIVFVQSGTISLLCDGSAPVTFTPRRFFLLPPGTSVLCTAVKPASLIVCRLHHALKYCDNLPVEQFQGCLPDAPKRVFDLTCNRPILKYIDSLAEAVGHGFRCRTYLTAKLTELLYLLRGYYSTEDLVSFFRPFLGRDIHFRGKILSLIRHGSNVSAMAQACHLSESGFRSKFKREFGEPPNVYLMGRKRSVILDALTNGTEPFTRIALDNNLSGLNALNKFCREQFDRTPSEIRYPNGRAGVNRGKFAEKRYQCVEK